MIHEISLKLANLIRIPDYRRPVGQNHKELYMYWHCS